MNEDCVFCKIIEGKIPAYKIYEDEKHLAFMDAFPSIQGQVLVVPKKHVKNYLEMNEEDYKQLLSAARKVARKMKEVLKPRIVALIIEGLDVPHVHVKLYPLQEGQYLGIPMGKKANETELKNLSNKLKF